MPSGTSFFENRGWFNSTLLKKNLGRFWPLWALYGLLWLFCLPVTIFLARPGLSMNYQVIQLLQNALGTSPIIGTAYAVLVAMALFSYLMNNRSAGMLHSLPIRREGLFCTNFVSGLVFIAGPTLVVTLLTLVAQASKGVLGQPRILGMTLKWFGVNLMVTLMFFAFAVCCAMFTGHILALPIFYGILNFLVIGVCFLLDMACEVLLVGFDGFGLSASTFARWCTPVYHIWTRLRVYGYSYDDAGGMVQVGGVENGALIAVCYSLVLCCVFISIAVLVYRNRQMERAGDVVTVGWVRPIFQYGVGVCGGLALGGFLYAVFFRRFGPWAYITCVALCAVIGAFIARMLLKKSLRVFGDWKGPAVLSLCMVLLLGGIKLDALGFQRRVPGLDGVESITLQVYSTAPQDTASGTEYRVEVAGHEARARAVADFHRALVSDLSRLDENNMDRYENLRAFDDEGYVNSDTVTVYLTYHMKNGRELRRSYDGFLITRAELEQEGSYANLLQGLINEPEAVKQSYFMRGVDESSNVISASLENFGENMEGPGADIPITVGMNGQVELTDQQAKALWAAFREDLDAGRVKRYLLDDRERLENCYYYNNLYFQVTVRRDPLSKEQYDVTQIVVTPEKSMTSLMAAMEELGLSQYLSQWDGK